MSGSHRDPNFENLAYAERMYEAFRRDPSAVPASWRSVFEAGDMGNGPAAAPASPPSIFHSGRPRDLIVAREVIRPVPSFVKQMGVLRLIDWYRMHGHHEARLDPLELDTRPEFKEPPITAFGLDNADLDAEFWIGDFGPQSVMTLRRLRDRLRQVYCGTVGVEYTHILNEEQADWLRRAVETESYLAFIDGLVERHAAEKIIRAEAFEQFLHRKFVGTKRFSLEGAEAVVPALDAMIEFAAERGVETFILGMAHRGRINVLANILNKPPEMIFNEFEDILDHRLAYGSGDVKYHLGYNNEYTTRAGKNVWLTLTPNPSHLEAVNPVVEGRVRARQDDLGGPAARDAVLPFLIHGDAAFSGQGLVTETLNLGLLPGYRTGGTVHLIINNQLGFTTAPIHARSTLYCSDVAKMLQVPVFHVNGDDVRGLIGVLCTAFEFRRRFGLDAVVDMWCFRRYGHNETDEPAFTQPKMYGRIDKHPGTRTIYVKSLVDRRLGTSEEFDGMREAYGRELEHAYERSASPGWQKTPYSTLQGKWRGIRPASPDDIGCRYETGAGREAIDRVTRALSEVPERIKIHRKLKRLLETRRRMGAGEEPMDWAMGELLAFGTLAHEGYSVRVSGQDSRRGTFSQRHAIFVDGETEEEYAPLQHVSETQAPVWIWDSMLSEAAVLGFEYGFSLETPDGLVCWEAQFGDFVNGAQVIIDQFIASAEAKWKRHSGIVLLLPHGYDGQGPEHSSARLERFLQLCAESNIQVAYPTTPAQHFHLLRRQLHRPFRKPLVVMTPKSLLRHKMATSRADECVEGCFQELLPDPRMNKLESADRIVFCTGKFYYDLARARDDRDIRNVALVRLEQLYPFPDDQVRKLIVSHPKAEIVWAQEEPANAGALQHFLTHVGDGFTDRRAIVRVSRPASAAPATGHAKRHLDEQRQIVDEALAGTPASGRKAKAAG
ncbi:2-oxoglutarate dehydrogenase E1 component [bacterium]|nr:2-oxoglutarate dehydrogenase E1 component [bacterium]